MTAARFRAVVYLAGGLLVSFGVWVLASGPRVRLPAGPPVVVPAPTVVPAGPEQAAALVEYDAIAAANVFSSSRQPPPARFRLDRAVAATTPSQVREPAPPGPRMTLFGVAAGASGGVALIDADPAVPGAEIYRVGDRLRGYVLDVVTERFVVLRRNGDSLVLALPLNQRGSP